MTREEQLLRIKTAAGLSAYTQVLAPKAGTILGGLLGGYLGAQGSGDLTGAALGALAGGAAGGVLGRSVRGGLSGGYKGRPILGAVDDAAASPVFRLAGNAIPLAMAGAGALGGWGAAPLGEEAPYAMYGALAGLGGGLGLRAGARGAYRGLRNIATGANRPVTFMHEGQMVTAPSSQHQALLAQHGQKTSSLHDSIGYSVGVPGTPIGLKLDTGRSERLPGMARWVPQHTLESAFSAHDQGADEQAVIEQAANEGLLRDPIIGALLGALTTPTLIGGDAAQARIIGALSGGALGLGANLMGREGRREAMREALRGVARERQRFPMEKREDSTAASVPPMLLSSGSGEG